MIKILMAGLLLFSSPLLAITTQWLPTGDMTPQGKPSSILDHSVIEYRNAGAVIEDGVVTSTFDWKVSGDGPIGGWNGENREGDTEYDLELWLLDDSAGGVPGTSQATTQFSVISNSVSFVMAGDHNDGFAQFFVDDIYLGKFDLFDKGHTSLVVTGLDAIKHSLKVVQLGEHVPEAKKGDIAIFGGAAFNIPVDPNSVVSEPNIFGLLFAAMIALYGTRKFKYIQSKNPYTGT